MSPISSRILPKAVSAVQVMDLKTKEQLADEIFRNQLMAGFGCGAG
jgi:hypothetical protein